MLPVSCSIALLVLMLLARSRLGAVILLGGVGAEVFPALARFRTVEHGCGG
jgi:hypothetical protein